MLNKPLTSIACTRFALAGIAHAHERHQLSRAEHYPLVFSCVAPATETADCITHVPPVTYSSPRTCEHARGELEQRLSSSPNARACRTSFCVLCMSVLAE